MTSSEYEYGYRVRGTEFWPTDYGPDGFWIGENRAYEIHDVDFTFTRTDEEKLTALREAITECPDPVTILRKLVTVTVGPVEEVE